MLMTAVTNVQFGSPAAGPLLVGFKEVQPLKAPPARGLAGVVGHLARVKLLLVTKKGTLLEDNATGVTLHLHV